MKSTQFNFSLPPILLSHVFKFSVEKSCHSILGETTLGNTCTITFFLLEFSCAIPQAAGLGMVKPPEWASKHSWRFVASTTKALWMTLWLYTMRASHVHCDNVWCKEVQGQCKQHQHYIWYRKGE